MMTRARSSNPTNNEHSAGTLYGRPMMTAMTGSESQEEGDEVHRHRHRRQRRNRQRPRVSPSDQRSCPSNENNNNEGVERRRYSIILEPSLSTVEDHQALIGDDMIARTELTTAAMNGRTSCVGDSSSDEDVPVNPPDQFQVHRSPGTMLEGNEIVAHTSINISARTAQILHGPIEGSESEQVNEKPGAYPARGRPVGIQGQPNPDQHPTGSNPQRRRRSLQEDQIQLLRLSDRLSSSMFAQMLRTQHDIPIATAILLRRPSLRRQAECRGGRLLMRCSITSTSSYANDSNNRRMSLPPSVPSSDPTSMPAARRPALIRQHECRSLRCSATTTNRSTSLLQEEDSVQRRLSYDPSAMMIIDASVRLASMTTRPSTQQYTYSAIPPELRPAMTPLPPPSVIPSMNVQRIDFVENPTGNTANMNRSRHIDPYKRLFKRIIHHNH